MALFPQGREAPALNCEVVRVQVQDVSRRASAARRGSVWLLPVPGSDEQPRRIKGHELNRLIDGDILDAYGTDLFGEEVTRSEHSKEKLQKLARLNRKRLNTPLSSTEQRELEQLRATMPSSPSNTATDVNNSPEPLQGEERMRRKSRATRASRPRIK